MRRGNKETDNRRYNNRYESNRLLSKWHHRIGDWNGVS